MERIRQGQEVTDVGRPGFVRWCLAGGPEQGFKGHSGESVDSDILGKVLGLYRLASSIEFGCDPVNAKPEPRQPQMLHKTRTTGTACRIPRSILSFWNILCFSECPSDTLSLKPTSIEGANCQFGITWKLRD